MPSSAAIECEQVTVRYPSKRVSTIDKITFQVKTGSIATLLGPNGAGKSTLIKAILGIIPFEGSIKIFGQPIQSQYLTIGYVPQRIAFDFKIPITVSELLHLALIGCQKCHHKRNRLVRQALKRVDMSKYSQTNLGQLSGGQLQRVLIARALVHQPKLLILDEPEAGIDVGAEQSLFELLQRLRQDEQVTILFASHELDVVYGFSDQVVCINRKLVCTGKPQTVLTKKTFTELYGGNITFYTHGHTHS